MTNWKSLEHHRGSAADIPTIIADMVGGPDTPVGREERFDHHLTLQDRLYREGQWIEAAPAAIHLLFQSMTDDAQEAHRLIWHINLLTTGGVNYALRQGLPLQRGEAPFQKATLDTTSSYEATLLEWLEIPDKAVRSLSARLLGLLPAGNSQRVVRLEHLAESASESLAACNAALALGLLARHQGQKLNQDLLKKLMSDGLPVMVRAGAALAWAWNELPINEELLSAFVSLGGEHRHYPELDWSLVIWTIHHQNLLSFLPVSQSYKESLSVQWLERWNAGPFRSEVPPVQELLVLVGSCDSPSENGRAVYNTEPKLNVRVFDEITQKLILLSAHRNCLGAELMPGVPSTWHARRRWLGLDPSTLLEQECFWQPQTKIPVWQAWWQHINTEALDEWGLPQAWTDMTLLQRLELICEAKVNSYSLEIAVERVSGEQVRALAESCSSDPEFEKWAIGFLTSMASLPDTGPITHLGPKNEYAFPLMSVLLDHGIDLPEALDAIFRFDGRNDLEIIRRLPLERRRKILAHPDEWRTYNFIVPLLSTYPFKDYALAALDGIAEARAKGGAYERKGNKLLQTVKELAVDHPEIAQALAEARARPEWVPEGE